MYTVILLRHAQSEWNLQNLFTGWTDVDLSKQGLEDAVKAGELLLKHDLLPDVVYTSYLTRAIKTANIALERCNRLWIPMHKHWRLNERHYGSLQGSNKEEKAKEYGEEQVHLWRRSYDVRPPQLSPDDPRHPKLDPRYASLQETDLPAGECLKDTVDRVLPYWNDVLVPAITQKKLVLISAHGNSLRALVKHLDSISDQAIPELEIPTGIPLVYTLDENLAAVEHSYLA